MFVEQFLKTKLYDCVWHLCLCCKLPVELYDCVGPFLWFDMIAVGKFIVFGPFSNLLYACGWPFYVLVFCFALSLCWYIIVVWGICNNCVWECLALLCFSEILYSCVGTCVCVALCFAVIYYDCVWPFYMILYVCGWQCSCLFAILWNVIYLCLAPCLCNCYAL